MNICKNTRRVQFKCDGTRWRKGRGSEKESGEWSVYSITAANAPVVDWADAPAYLNGLVRFAERQNPVSARVTSHFRHTLPTSSRLTMCHISRAFERNVMEFDAKVSPLIVNGCILVWLHADDSNGRFSRISPRFCSHFKLNFLNIYRNEKYLEQKL